MSGICGVYGSLAQRQYAERETRAMLARLQHRGPDGACLYEDEQCILGLTALDADGPGTGSKVLFNEDQSIVMVCDGQVFNSSDLRPWLEGRGHRFWSPDSCEALVHLYEEGGLHGIRRADGQFGLALWDRNSGELVLIRDFLGVRPVYFYQGDGGTAFASEIKALLQHPDVPRGCDEVAVGHYLTFLNVPSPRTLFKGISKVPPGSAVFIRRTGTQTVRYWDLADNPIPESDDEHFYVDRVRDLHRNAVSRRCTSSPIGAMLSGGNDSSANAVLMTRQRCFPLHTFTVGLADVEGLAGYNDMQYAREVAQLIESEHHETLLSTQEFLATIPKIVDAMDDTVSEPSSVFLYHALRLAKENGVRVVLTGEANDELCCGHGEMISIRNRYYTRWLPFKQKPQWMRKLAAAASPVLWPRRAEILRRVANDEEYFWNFEIAWTDSVKPEILSTTGMNVAGRENSASVVRATAARFRATEHSRRDYLNYIVYAMMQDYYFGNLMLGKLDLLSSELGIEPRCPYTSPEYAHLVYNVPAKFKMEGGTVKSFFKKAIEGVLPHHIIYRPKQGFRTPVVELFKGSLGNWAEQALLDMGLTRSGLLRRDRLEQILVAHRGGQGDYSNRLWTAMALNLWHERWISARPAPMEPLSNVVRTNDARSNAAAGAAIP